MLCLKQLTLLVVLRLLGSLFQVLNPTYGKLCIPNFAFPKLISIFWLKGLVATPLSSTGHKTSLKYSGH